MARRPFQAYDRVVVSPSLLQGITIHPTSARFSLGMEEWTDSYLKQLEKENPTLKFDTATPSLGVFERERDISLHPLNRAASSERATKQPHPQRLEPPPKKQRFSTLSSEELG